jgi:hypothetical protein
MLPNFVDFAPSATTVVNGIDMASVALGKVLDQVTMPGDQNLSFLVTPCGEPPPHYISVKLTVVGFVQISDAGDDDESVRLTLNLDAGNGHDSQTANWNGQDSDGGPVSVHEVAQVAIKEDSPFNVHASLLEFCVTDGRVGWGATVSMIRIDQIQIVVEVIDEATYKKINTPAEPGIGSGGSGKKKKKPSAG